MTRPKSIALEDEPETTEVPLWQPDASKIVTDTRFMSEVARRRYEVIYDPSGDFSRGSRFGRDDLWAGKEQGLKYGVVLPCWAEGLIVFDRKLKTRMVLGSDRHFHTLKEDGTDVWVEPRKKSGRARRVQRSVQGVSGPG